MFWYSPDCPQQCAAFGEIPASGLCTFAYPPAQIFEVGDLQRHYCTIFRLNAQNAGDVCCMLEEYFPALVNVASNHW